MRPQSSFLDFSEASNSEILNFFSSYFTENSKSFRAQVKSLALVFFEPSTRTRMSFELAAKQLSISTVLFDLGQGTSLEKGESLEDTLLNISAMGFDGIVLRSPQRLALYELSAVCSQPIVNAGWGHSSHPTQALLDMQTLFNRWGSVHSKRILFVGDIRHSRVFSSHLELSQKLGYELGFLGPSDWCHPQFNGQIFSSLNDALPWADAVVALRVQSERHDARAGGIESTWGSDYFDQFGINKERMKLMQKNCFLLHPGPINFGTELDRDVLSHENTIIFEQVATGVSVRKKLLQSIFDTSK